MTNSLDCRKPEDPCSRPAVAHLMTEFLPRTETWLYSQIRWNEAFRHVVLCRRRIYPDEFPWDGVLVRSSPRGIRARFRGLLREKDLPGEEILSLQSHQPQLIHAHHGWEGYRALELRDRLGLPMVTSFYGLDASKLPRKWWWRRRYRELFRKGDLFLTEGPHMQKQLTELGAPKERTRVVALGIDLHRIPFRARTATEEPRILMAASFREKKGHRYALEAFQRIAERFPKAALEFIGHGPLRPVISGAVPISLVPRVIFHGSCSYDRYLQLLSQATLLLAPSVTGSDGDTEGGAPVCLLEGQASGIPIVATSHCDIPNVIHPAGRGFLVPERDTEALAHALTRLLENPADWPRLGEAARRWAEEKFDIRTQAAKTADVYRELLR